MSERCRRSTVDEEECTMSRRCRQVLPLAATLLAIVVTAGAMRAQAPPPNPYRLVDRWAQLPAGMQWAGVISVDPDPKGNVWVFHRSEPPLLKFDPTGRLAASFGSGMFVQAHGMAL